MKNGDCPVRYVSLPEATYHIFVGQFFREYPEKIWPGIWYSSIFRILKFPLKRWDDDLMMVPPSELFQVLQVLHL